MGRGLRSGVRMSYASGLEGVFAGGDGVVVRARWGGISGRCEEVVVLERKVKARRDGGRSARGIVVEMSSLRWSRQPDENDFDKRRGFSAW